MANGSYVCYRLNMKKERVFVGLSGGVDSSVAAKRLVERGYDVVGVFIKVWQPAFIECNWEAERLDAMRVAAHLGIPFLTCDAEDAYKRHVADYMVEEYRQGRTPNPDVMCNEFVKFGAFYEWAKAHGAEKVATGHYARVQDEGSQHTLHVANDVAKDQTYFLARIAQDALNHALFPIGDSLKSEIREEARRAGLPTHKKADSQGICFLGTIDIREFLSHYVNLSPGVVIDENGTIIGEHSGALLYTLGQRHGFRISCSDGSIGPHYVIARDIDKNTITVSETPHARAPQAPITLSRIHELGSGVSERMDAVFRYHGKRIPVHFGKRAGKSAILIPETGMEDTPAAGQLAVFYRNDECVGCGVIE